MVATRIAPKTTVAAASRLLKQSSVRSNRAFALAARPVDGWNSRSENRGGKSWRWGYVGVGAALGYAGVGAAFWSLEKDTLSAYAKAGPKLVPSEQLHGKWKKVEEVGQEQALLQMSLNWVFRQAAGLLVNLELSVDKETVRIVTQGGLVIYITEKYGFDGAEYECSRRDNRSGKHVGKIIEATPSKFVLRITWDEPHGGEMYETFELIEGDKLKQTTRIKVNNDATTGKPGEWYTYFSVFSRQ